MLKFYMRRPDLNRSLGERVSCCVGSGSLKLAQRLLTRFTIEINVLVPRLAASHTLSSFCPCRLPASAYTLSEVSPASDRKLSSISFNISNLSYRSLLYRAATILLHRPYLENDENVSLSDQTRAAMPQSIRIATTMAEEIDMLFELHRQS